ncbi:MAG: ribonuclease P protein component [Planctomycetes bacterium]|nr:ribonuclease P protein component [Planctomycetota bacterium]
MGRGKSRFGFSKALHLRSPAEFRRVYDNKCSVSNALLVLYGRGNDLEHPRLGLSVARKVGSAVVRNRLRRLYREAFRLTQAELPASIDLVLIPRGPQEPTLDELKTSLPKLAHALVRKMLGKGIKP